MKRDGHWVVLDALQFVNNLSLSLRVDDPLNITLRRIFSEMIGKLMRYSGSAQGLHLLSNTVLNDQGHVSVFEMNYLYIDEETHDYLDSALEQRQPYNEGDVEKARLPHYTQIKVEQLRGHGLQTILVNDLMAGSSPCCPVIQEKSKWEDLIAELNHRPSTGELVSNHQSKIVCDVPNILVIPFSKSSPKLPGGNLGTILLWNNQAKNSRATWQSLEERILLVAKIFQVFVSQLLSTRYGVIEETYLPSFRMPGERSVAIMFANVRNFTPTTEIARNFKLVHELTEFMLDFHRTMGEIIRKQRGRVHNLASDGLMAVFGEHESEKEAATFAVHAAMEMCREFNSLKSRFFSNERVQAFLLKEYEPVDFQLAIGINLGSVIFDYFGATGCRIYGPIGDHVNFAQLLESEASQYDSQGKIRAPILLSRPAWLRSGINPNQKPVMLQLRGKPYEYQAYECWP